MFKYIVNILICLLFVSNCYALQGRKMYDKFKLALSDTSYDINTTGDISATAIDVDTLTLNSTDCTDLEGSGLVIATSTLKFDATELQNVTWDDGSNDTLTHTFQASGGDVNIQYSADSMVLLDKFIITASTSNAALVALTNTNTTVGAETYILTLDNYADADPEADFIRCRDNANTSPASMFTVEYDGDVTAAGTLNVNAINASTDNFTIYSTGNFTNTDGIVTTSHQYSGGLVSLNYGDDTPEHSNLTGSYDHTGGTYEKLFTKPAGAAFTSADATNGNWILMTGANQGAMAEIKEYVSATQVVVGGMGWDGDLASQTFSIIKHPAFITGSDYLHEFNVDGSGEFEIYSYSFTGSKMIKFKNNVAADGADILHIQADCNGYSNVDAMQIFYETNGIVSGDECQVIQITIDESTASDGTVDGIFIETTDATSVDKNAIHIAAGFDTAISVSGASSDNPDYGYEYDPGNAPVDRVNSGGAGDNAFINTSTDQQIFDTNGDVILIGNDDQFEVIEYIANTASSKDLNPTFWYSNNTNGSDTGVVGWTQFYPDDSTEGFTRSGLIDWTSWGAAWDEDDLAEAGQAITEGYYIAIIRNRAGALTEPVEDHFKIYLEQGGDTGMKIKGDGRIKLPYLTGAPGSLENGDMWMESDGLHIYANGSEEVVANV